MSVTDLPLFATLKTRMYWAAERERLLAQTADANVPAARGELKQLDFHGVLRANPVGAAGETEAVAINGRGEAEPDRLGGGIAPGGRVRELARTEKERRAATALYVRGLALIRAALGRR
jgi:hypothetical protein